MRISDTYKMMYEKKSSPPWNTGKQDYAGAAKELKDYAMKDGGIDKKDMLAVASQLASQAKSPSASVAARMMRNIQGLDTDVREKIFSILKKHGLKESLESDLKLVEEMEEIELEEAVLSGRDYKVKNGKVHISQANFKKVSKDYKNDTKGKERMTVLDPKTQATVSMPVVFEEVELDEARDPSKSGGSGYDLYHKDFSSAMKHAYDYAKKKFGITIDPKEIDDKVASGPRKPSSGKTNTYRLKGDKGSVQIQVANLDNKKYELNMYKEEVEMDEGRVYVKTSEGDAYDAGKKAVEKGISYDKNPNKKGTKEYTAWSRGHNDARATKISNKHFGQPRLKREEVEMENIEEAEFFKWEVKVGGRTWRGTARNAGEAVKKARPSMGNLDLSKASITRVNEDINMQEEQKISLEEAIMQAVLGEKKMDPVDKKALKKDYDDRAKDGDGDLDNDGDEDKTDKYLHKRRQAVTKAIGKKGEPVDTNPTMDEENLDEISPELAKRAFDARAKKIAKDRETSKAFSKAADRYKSKDRSDNLSTDGKMSKSAEKKRDLKRTAHHYDKKADSQIDKLNRSGAKAKMSTDDQIKRYDKATDNRSPTQKYSAYRKDGGKLSYDQYKNKYLKNSFDPAEVERIMESFDPNRFTQYGDRAEQVMELTAIKMAEKKHK